MTIREMCNELDVLGDNLFLKINQAWNLFLDLTLIQGFCIVSLLVFFIIWFLNDSSNSDIKAEDYL